MNQKKIADILTTREKLLAHTDLIPDPRYPLFEDTLLYLLQMCEIYKPERILDTGSGLTSILLRKYNPNSMIITLDTDDDWLQKTHQLFARFDPLLHSRHRSSLMNKKRFEHHTWKPKFDLLCHDLGNMTTRIITLPGIITYMAPQCVALFDNFGVPPFNSLAHPFLLSKGFLPLHPADPMTVSTADAGGFAAYTRGHIKTQPLYNRLL